MFRITVFHLCLNKLFLWPEERGNKDTDKLVLLQFFSEGNFLEQAIGSYFLGAYDLMEWISLVACFIEYPGLFQAKV